MPEERSRTIRILHVTTSLAAFSGIEETIRILIHGLDRGRFRIGLASIVDPPGAAVEELKATGVEIHVIHRRGSVIDVVTTSKLIGILGRFGADIVHTHRNKGNFHGRIAAQALGIPIVTTHHDMGDLEFSRSPFSGRRMNSIHSNEHPDFVQRWIFPFLNVKLDRMNHRVIAVSDHVRRIHAASLADTRVETIHAPFDESLFPKSWHGLRHPEIVIGTAGSLGFLKGHIHLIRAMRILRDAGRDIRWRIAGDGPLRAELEAAVEKEGIADRVTFLGFQAHDARLYEGLDLYVQPSLAEGCSITLLEAMASGIPVIASDIDGPTELIEHGVSGLLVPPAHPESLASAIASLADDRGKAAAIGQAGHERSLSRFSSRVFLEKMSRVYEECAALPSRAGIDYAPL